MINRRDISHIGVLLKNTKAEKYVQIFSTLITRPGVANCVQGLRPPRPNWRLRPNASYLSTLVLCAQNGAVIQRSCIQIPRGCPREMLCFVKASIRAEFVPLLPCYRLNSPRIRSRQGFKGGWVPFVARGPLSKTGSTHTDLRLQYYIQAKFFLITLSTNGTRR